jgi:protein involved in polysaccharide export with SLBB domain
MVLRQTLVALWALSALASLAACSTTQSIRPRPVNAQAFAPWSDAPVEYRLGAGDKIKVGFLLTPELDEEATVAPDGAIALKATGRIPAANLTLDELQAEVETAARRNLRHPVVSVGVVETPSARVIVGGAVAAPGVYPLPPRGSPLEAVMLAGGLQPAARMDEVVILRRRRDNVMMMRTVDLNRFVSRADISQSLALAPEDIVFVPRSHIAEVNLWLDENIEKVLPFSRSVGYTITSNGVIVH